MGKAIIEAGVVIVVKAVYAEVLSKVDVFSETKFFSIDRLIGQWFRGILKPLWLAGN